MSESTAYADDYTAEASELREVSTFDKLNMEFRAVLDEQEKVLAALADRLSPVLRVEAEKMPATVPTPHALRSPLADQLSEYLGRITASNRRIDEFVHRLDT